MSKLSQESQSTPDTVVAYPNIINGIGVILKFSKDQSHCYATGLFFGGGGIRQDLIK